MSAAAPSIDGTEAGCQVVLISPPRLPDPARFAPLLEATLGVGGIAAFLLHLADIDEGGWRAAVAHLRPVCAACSVAFLLQDDAELALEFGADGVHLGLGGHEGVAAVRARLGAERILGASCGRSRDAAMLAGEQGADYIGFGASDRPADPRVVDLIRWWSELFVLPCLVEGAIHAADCAPLVRAGADFVGLSRGVWEHPEGPQAGLRAVRQAIADAGVPWAQGGAALP